MRGIDTERHQPAIGRNRAGSLYRLRESCSILDQMISRQHQHLRIVSVLGLQRQRGYRDRRCGVAAHGLEQKLMLRFIKFRHLAIGILGNKKIVSAGHGDHLAVTGHIGRTAKGFLHQRLAIRQLHKWFGVGMSGNRPQTGTCATGQNDGNQHIRLTLINRFMLPAQVLKAKPQTGLPVRQLNGECIQQLLTVQH